MKKKRILCSIGTRPEAIKMAPVVETLRAEPWAEVRVLATAQHRDVLGGTLVQPSALARRWPCIWRAQPQWSAPWQMVLPGRTEPVAELTLAMVCRMGTGSTILVLWDKD